MFSAKVEQGGNEVLVTLRGRFDFGGHEEFKAVIGEVQRLHCNSIVIDFSDVEDLDSSALGMLLLFRDAVGGGKANISIVKSQPKIRSVLEMVKFQRFFTLN